VKMAGLKDSMSNPLSEVIRKGQALSDLATRISNRLANRPPTSDAYTVPVHAQHQTLRERSNDAVLRRPYIVEPRLRRPQPSEHCLHCTVCSSSKDQLPPCPVNPLVQLTASA
jgi:hypothetical protein